MDLTNPTPQHPPGPVAYAPRVEFRVLGPVEVLEADRRKSVGGPKQRTVLALIIANAGQVISTDRIIEGTWGEEPPSGARRSLHTYVSNLRGELGDVIAREGEGYVLTVEREAVDWTRFEDLSPSGRPVKIRQAARSSVSIHLILSSSSGEKRTSPPRSSSS